MICRERPSLSIARVATRPSIVGGMPQHTPQTPIWLVISSPRESNVQQNRAAASPCRRSCQIRILHDPLVFRYNIRSRLRGISHKQTLRRRPSLDDRVDNFPSKSRLCLSISRLRIGSLPPRTPAHCRFDSMRYRYSLPGRCQTASPSLHRRPILKPRKSISSGSPSTRCVAFPAELTHKARGRSDAYSSRPIWITSIL
jgi:hypothetical protein